MLKPNSKISPYSTKSVKSHDACLSKQNIIQPIVVEITTSIPSHPNMTCQIWKEIRIGNRWMAIWSGLFPLVSHSLSNNSDNLMHFGTFAHLAVFLKKEKKITNRGHRLSSSKCFFFSLPKKKEKIILIQDNI